MEGVESSPPRSCCSRRTKLEIVLSVLLGLLLLAVVLWFSLMGIAEEECETPECIAAANKFIQYIDPDVDPCTNFYKFACGNFIKNYAIENDIETPLELHKRRIDQQTKEIASEKIGVHDAHSLRVLKELYGSCMDVEEIDKDDDKIIRGLIEKLGGWPLVRGQAWDGRDFSWVDITVRARRLGLRFNWFVDLQNYEMEAVLPKLTHPEPIQTLTGTTKRHYVNLMKTTAEHFGARNISSLDLEMTFEFEEKLAQIIKSIAKKPNADEDQMEQIVDFQNRWPQLNWLKFLYNITATEKNVTDNYKIVNAIEAYMWKFDKLISYTPARIQANYFIWKTLYELGPYCTKPVREEFEAFQLVKAKKAKERSDTCLSFVSKNLNHVIESEYVRRYVNDDLQKGVGEMLSALKNEVEVMVSENSWMDAETKAASTAKTFKIKDIIGGPAEMFDHSEYDAKLGLDKFVFSSTNVVDMLTQLKQHLYEKFYSKIYEGNPDLFERFYLDFSEINGRFHMASNALMLSAPIIRGDFYNENRPSYLNFGGIGSVSSHELAHGFDNDVSLYFDPETFTFGQWITDDSLERYGEKLKCLISESTRFTKKANASSTMSENLADFVGINIAYRSYQKLVTRIGIERKLPGLRYTPNQLFWIQASSYMCYTDEDMDEEEVHSIPEFRVVGPLRNSKYFAEDFGCPANSEMNPEVKCQLI